jgi:anaerobic selenocysteine-containing dehydrogenase
LNAQPDINIHHRTCPLCEAICGLRIEHRGRKILAIRGDHNDPFSRGHICPKAIALQDLQSDPDRLTRPVKRVNGGWQPIGWQEAFETAAARLIELQDRHGRDAVASYVGNPNVHNLGAMLFLPRFHEALGTRNRFSSSSVDQLPHQLVSLFLFGHDYLLPVPDIDRTDYFLMLGANPAASNGSLLTAPDIGRRLKDIRKRGGKVVLIDPRRTESAAFADQHLFIRPGSDVLLLLAMLHTIFGENLANPGRLAEFTDGIDGVRRISADYPPEVVGPHTGITADRIRTLAREFARAPRAVCYGRIGTCLQEFAGLTQWLLAALNIVTGRLDAEGGYMFPLPAVDVIAQLAGAAGGHGHYGEWRSRARDLPEFSGELPSAGFADEMLTPGDGQVRALITLAGNPVLSLPNSEKLERALAGLEFMVSIDFYVNETTRHADLILPPTGPLEHDHYDLVFHVVAIRNTSRYAQALFEPAADARHDWQILCELAKRLELRKAALDDGEDTLAGVPRPDQIIDQGLRLGPYGQARNGIPALSLEALKANPSGIDLGPLAPCLPGRLFTPDKRIRLDAGVFLKDLERVRLKWFSGARAANEFDMLLIGRRDLRSNNSWMHNSERLVKGRNRCTALLHADDAARHGIRSGDRVRVSSRVGAVEIEAEVTEDIMPGVVSIPHGWGHDRPGVKLRTARRHAGTNLNTLTDETLVDALSGNVATNGVPVRIARIGV